MLKVDVFEIFNIFVRRCEVEFQWFFVSEFAFAYCVKPCVSENVNNQEVVCGCYYL